MSHLADISVAAYVDAIFKESLWKMCLRTKILLYTTEK